MPPAKTPDNSGAVDWDNINPVVSGFDVVFQFRNIGDIFIGKFAGVEDTYVPSIGESRAVAIFTDTETGNRVGIWLNHDLRGKLGKAVAGNLARIEYVSDREIRPGQDPMREFDVRLA